MKQRVIYPGTFDPVTFGHLDIIQRALQIFPEVIVAVAPNPLKSPLFGLQERMDMLKQATARFKGVTIKPFNGLAVEFARKEKAKVLVRGIRMLSYFEYEFQMALSNRKLAPDIETIFPMPQESHSYTSSKLLKEAAGLGADVRPFVPDFVARRLAAKLKR